MTAPSPTIFRSLEKTAGRDGFDTIVRAAVASFAALQRPTEAQARDFGRLVLPLFERIDPETRRILAASLAAASRLPRPVVERILAEPVEVAAPFLLASPLLTPDDIALLSKRNEPALKKLLVTRQASRRAVRMEAAPDVGRARAPCDAMPPAVAEARSAETRIAPMHGSRQTALLSIGTPDKAAEMRSPADPGPAEGATARAPSPRPRAGVDETREMLRRLARLGGIGDGAPPGAPDALLSLAILKDRDAFYAALGRHLFLDANALATIEADDAAEGLAVALKACGIAKADAMTILMMLKPTIGLDVGAFAAMETLYGRLNAEDCAARFRRVPSRPAARHQSIYAETGGVARGEARPFFGRRRSAPDAGVRKTQDR